MHRLADPATADILAARTGTELVPAGWSARERTADRAVGTGTGQAGAFQPAAAVQPGMAVPLNGPLQPVAALAPGAGMQPAMDMPHVGAMPQAASAALPAAGLVPVPAVPARTLLSLGPAEFVLAVNSPRYRLVKLARAVPARLPRGAKP